MHLYLISATHQGFSHGGHITLRTRRCSDDELVLCRVAQAMHSLLFVLRDNIPLDSVCDVIRKKSPWASRHPECVVSLPNWTCHKHVLDHQSAVTVNAIRLDVPAHELSRYRNLLPSNISRATLQLSNDCAEAFLLRTGVRCFSRITVRDGANLEALKESDVQAYVSCGDKWHVRLCSGMETLAAAFAFVSNGGKRTLCSFALLAGDGTQYCASLSPFSELVPPLGFHYTKSLDDPMRPKQNYEFFADVHKFRQAYVEFVRDQDPDLLLVENEEELAEAKRTFVFDFNPTNALVLSLDKCVEHLTPKLFQDQLDVRCSASVIERICSLDELHNVYIPSIIQGEHARSFRRSGYAPFLRLKEICDRAKALRIVDAWFHFVGTMCALAAVFGCLPRRVVAFHYSRMWEFAWLARFLERRIVPPPLRGHSATDKVRVEGGDSKDPVVGLHLCTGMSLDVRSMYPELIVKHKICFTRDGDVIPVLMRRFVMGRRRITENAARLFDVIQKLKIQIDEAKQKCTLTDSDSDSETEPRSKMPTDKEPSVKQLKHKLVLLKQQHTNCGVIANALKLAANAGWGVLGYSRARFRNRHLSARITSEGRLLLQDIITEAERNKLTVLSAHTDGLFVSGSYKTVSDMCNRINNQTENENSVWYRVHLKCEARFDRILFLNFKEYAYVNTFPPEVCTTGMPHQRQDVCSFVKQLYESVLHLILEYPREPKRCLRTRITECIHTLCKPVRMGRVSVSQFLFMRRVKNDKRFLSVVRRMQARGYHVPSDSPLAFVACLDPVTANSVFFEEREFNQRPDLVVNVVYYLEMQALPYLKQLVCVCTKIMGVDDLMRALQLPVLNPEKRPRTRTPPALRRYTCHRCRAETMGATLVRINHLQAVEYGLRCKCGEPFHIPTLVTAVKAMENEDERLQRAMDLRDVLHLGTSFLALGLDPERMNQMKAEFVKHNYLWQENRLVLRGACEDLEALIASIRSSMESRENGFVSISKRQRTK